MPRLNEDLRVGLRIVQILKKSKEPLNSTQLAKKIGTTKFLVIKIAQDLIRKKIITSIRGIDGGFFLKKDKISALDIAEALGYKMSNPKQIDMIDGRLAKALYDLFSKTIIR